MHHLFLKHRKNFPLIVEAEILSLSLYDEFVAKVELYSRKQKQFDY